MAAAPAATPAAAPAKRPCAGCAAPQGILYIGPMFSGKTSQIMRLVDRARLAEQRCLVVKYCEDNRYGRGPALRAHTREALGSEPDSPARGSVRVVEAGPRLLDTVAPEEGEVCVAIDEGQFYEDLPEACGRWLDEGRSVYVAALDADSRRRPMGEVHRLVPLMDRVEKLSAICMVCRQREAPHTLRLSADSHVVLIGGAEAYRAACRECYRKHAEE